MLRQPVVARVSVVVIIRACNNEYTHASPLLFCRRVPAGSSEKTCPKIAMVFDVYKSDLDSLMYAAEPNTIDQVRLYMYEVCLRVSQTYMRIC